MTKISETIVFFGSGPVAAKSLSLLKQIAPIEAVITKPATETEMKRIAGKVPVYSVAAKKELDELVASKHFKSRLGVLIDFGIIVSRSVIDAFELGIVNSHFSLLPELRGADPISFAILNGQKVTGVSLMLLVEAMDEGPLLGYGEHPINDRVDTPELTDKLISLSQALLSELLPKYLAGEILPSPQSVTGRKVSYSRKLNKSDGQIDWNKSAAEIDREIRAFREWPKSVAKVGGKEVIITAAHVEHDEPDKKSGETSLINGKILLIQTGRGALFVERLKPAGKQEMTAQAFINGYLR